MILPSCRLRTENVIRLLLIALTELVLWAKTCGKTKTRISGKEGDFYGKFRQSLRAVHHDGVGPAVHSKTPDQTSADRTRSGPV